MASAQIVPGTDLQNRLWGNDRFSAAGAIGVPFSHNRP
jgi:hypothetical protein